jgi:hypothetical protein
MGFIQRKLAMGETTERRKGGIIAEIGTTLTMLIYTEEGAHVNIWTGRSAYSYLPYAIR